MSRALGRYELLRPLARGGMGEVFLARRRAAGVEKVLVVKRMRPERAGDARFLDLFVREARLSMSLAHQNIVPVFDFGRIDDQVFLAMERVEGRDLGSSLAKAGRPLAPLLAAFVAGECCQALDYAHRRRGPDGAGLGIVHRDVTPRNVLLSWSGEVKLTDFGIAALAGDESTKMAGTPAYMAPEQARGEALDARADVYALGLVLREALTGLRARPGLDREAIVAAAQRGMLDPWPDDCDPDLRTITDRATAADPGERYVDARSMLEALDAFMVGQRAAIKGESPARQLAAWLTDVWKEERDEGPTDDTIEGDHLVSFLDDGALDVIGTGTVRSMIATAAEAVDPPAHDSTERVESTPGLPQVIVEPSSAGTSRRASSSVPADLMPRASSPASGAGVPRAITAGTTSRPGEISQRALTALGPRPTWPWIAAAIAFAAASAGVVALVMSRPASDGRSVDSTGTASGSASGTGSAAAIGSAAGTGSGAGTGTGSGVGIGVGSGTGSGDGIGVASGSGFGSSAVIAAGSGSAHPPVARDLLRGSNAAHVLPHPRPGPGSAAGSAAPPAPRYKVTINSQPWSDWTVDGEPAKHTGLETIELTTGKHRIHFTGSPHFVADQTVTIDVPDHDGFRWVEALKELAPPAP